MPRWLEEQIRSMYVELDYASRRLPTIIDAVGGIVLLTKHQPHKPPYSTHSHYGYVYYWFGRMESVRLTFNANRIRDFLGFEKATLPPADIGVRIILEDPIVVRMDQAGQISSYIPQLGEPVTYFFINETEQEYVFLAGVDSIDGLLRERGHRLGELVNMRQSLYEGRRAQSSTREFL